MQRCGTENATVTTLRLLGHFVHRQQVIAEMNGFIGLHRSCPRCFTVLVQAYRAEIHLFQQCQGSVPCTRSNKLDVGGQMLPSGSRERSLELNCGNRVCEYPES